ncbi:MAG: cytochrome P450 [Hyphomicrobiaceae bacterium]|nr:cytochrome P450 [Hyphomicrobiaceae bacterium]
MFPAPVPAPQRFASEAEAREVARTFDLRAIGPDFIANPYPVYNALREHAPVKALPGGGYLVSRIEDCNLIYKDPRRFSSDKKKEFLPKFGDGLLYQHHTTSLIFNDPPLHTRVRKIIAGALNARAVADMEAPMVALCDQLLDAMERKGEADLIADLAAAVPIEVIGNLLAIPHELRHPLRDWSLAILGALEPAPTRDMLATGETAVADFLDYLRLLVEDRRRRPGDPARDVLTRLIQGEQGGERLSEIELLQNVIFILNAGHETTTNLIGNGLYTLLEHADAKARLLAEPGLIHQAVEEFLRYEAPVQIGNRLVTEAVEIGGVAMPAGTFITTCIAGANRDPAEFADPDTLDLAREPNRHLAFASGPHFCVGLNIARMEGRIAIGRFLARFPGYRLAEPAVRGGRARFRGFLSIPVALG